MGTSIVFTEQPQYIGPDTRCWSFYGLYKFGHITKQSKDVATLTCYDDTQFTEKDLIDITKFMNKIDKG